MLSLLTEVIVVARILGFVFLVRWGFFFPFSAYLISENAFEEFLLVVAYFCC